MSRPEKKEAPQPRVRLAKAGDEDAIASILLESFSLHRDGYTEDAFAAVTPDAKEVAQRFDEGPTWVATFGEEIVGTLSVVPEPEWLYIRSVAVRPTALRLGIASKLMSAAEDWARERGFEKLFLYTTYFSTGAVELYEKKGFRRGRDTTAEEWFGTPGLEMWKDLN